MRIDVSAFLGAYPYRRVPGTSPHALRQAMERAAIDAAWVSHLPSLFWRDPVAGNAWLYETAAVEPRFKPVPAVHPGLSGWEGVLHDRAPELPAAAVRALLRSDDDVRLIVTHADRAFVEEVHFGSTSEAAARVWWDISWIWGPPEDHLETLLQTIGVERFVFGTGQPLRLPETSVAKLDLLELTGEQRAAIESGNVTRGLAN